jgi:cation transport ATPase
MEGRATTATDSTAEPSARVESTEPNADESAKQKRERELIELLNELRVALPGVQVLFAFLLTVPFSQGWTRLTTEQEAVYFGTFLATSLATALLLTPTAFHRLRFRRADKERLLRISNVAAIAGLVFLLAAVTGCVFLIADLLFDAPAAAIVAAIVGASYASLWFVLPLSRRLREAVDEEIDEHGRPEG